MNIMKIIGVLLAIIYAIGAFVFGAYWNYLFAVSHGFISWLFFGEIIPSLQATVWPIVLFSYDWNINLGY